MTPTPEQVEEATKALRDLPDECHPVSELPPDRDGQVTRYESPDVRDKPQFQRHRTVIFVNGMLNANHEHMASATLLSGLLCCPVLGVFNASQGFVVDLAQCVQDKLGLGVFTRGVPRTAAQWHALGVVTYAEFQRAGLLATRAQFVELLIARNAATLSLFRLLRSRGGNDRGVPIYAHSQGNLITSNALTAVAMADGVDAIRGRVVESYGSPCRTWPEGLNRRDHIFHIDPISLLQLRRTGDTVKVRLTLGDLVSAGSAHSFDAYVWADADFIINSCRWTALGYSLAIDRQALTQRLIDLGDNVARVLSVFQRLLDRHFTAEDDVAMRFAQRYERLGTHVLKRMLNDSTHGRELADVLDRCLTGRAVFVSQEKKRLARWIQSLRR